MAAINHNIFGDITILQTGTGITEDNLSRVDIGDIQLKANGREYQIDYTNFDIAILDDGTIEAIIEPNSLEEAKETFDFCEFDLTEADLSSPELETTVFVTYAKESSRDTASVAFKSGSIDAYLNNSNVPTAIAFDKAL